LGQNGSIHPSSIVDLHSSALKAFINERKPRGPARRPPKTQNGLSGKNSHPRSGGTEPQTPHPYHDQTQESSSQSSSADNGGPQTPSPLYSEPAANTVAAHPHVVESEVSKTLDTQSLDPQLARLLTSLSLSASGLKQEQPNKANGLAVKTDDRVPSEPTTPVPTSAITASSPHSHSRSGSMSGVEWWTSSPKRLPNQPFTPSHARRFTVDASPSASRHQPTSPTSLCSPLSPRSWLNGTTQVQSGPQVMESQSAGQPSLASFTASTSVSPSSRLSSRRSSSIADISPYLLRPAEVAMSGKRLKQLALLESVADESARMTPILGKRELIDGGLNPPLLHHRHSFAVGTSAPSPPLRPSDPNDLRVTYSSNIGAAASSPSAVRPAGQGSLHHQATVADDPFRVRPRSSNAAQHIHPATLHGSVSMNQEQLLAMMNGYLPADPRPPPPPQPHLAIYTTPVPPAMPGQQSVLNNRLSFVGMCPPGPAAARPGLDGMRVNNNMQLLSILNGDPNAVTTGTAFSPALNGLGR
jgi:mRNA-decapping enzyme subunit 2